MNKATLKQVIEATEIRLKGLLQNKSCIRHNEVLNTEIDYFKAVLKFLRESV